jgi:hypothetical protein
VDPADAAGDDAGAASPSLEGNLGEARLAIPPTTYPTVLDQFYADGYLMSVGLFVLFLGGSNQLESTGEADREREMRCINRVDLCC